MLALTPVVDFGVPPYKVQGDPLVALLAQLNRYAGKKVQIGRCDKRSYVDKAFSLEREAISDQLAQAADDAWDIVHSRYYCGFYTNETDEHAWVKRGESDKLAFVRWNLDQVTLIVAQAGDAAGLDAATVGITTRDSRLTPKFPTGKVVVIGALVAAIAGTSYFQWKKRSR